MKIKRLLVTALLVVLTGASMFSSVVLATETKTVTLINISNCYVTSYDDDAQTIKSKTGPGVAIDTYKLNGILQFYSTIALGASGPAPVVHDPHDGWIETIISASGTTSEYDENEYDSRDRYIISDIAEAPDCTKASPCYITVAFNPCATKAKRAFLHFSHSKFRKRS